MWVDDVAGIKFLKIVDIAEIARRVRWQDKRAINELERERLSGLREEMKMEPVGWQCGSDAVAAITT